jgi:uncharacterized MAPEG superfamily protein
MPITAAQTPELFWLTAVTVLTAVLWVPYVLNRILEHGLWAPLRSPPSEIPPRAAWAVRMVGAHQNAVENLVIFASLVLVAVIAHRTSAATAQAAMAYFIARLVHFVVYTAGIPLLRTLAFAAGWIASLTIALAIFGLS